MMMAYPTMSEINRAAFASSSALSLSNTPKALPWHKTPATDLEAAIARFKADLPGWWFSVCECQVSCDASCAPTVESPHVHLIPSDDRFDSGFHADLAQPSSLAEALDTVRLAALEALAATPLTQKGEGE